MNLILLTLLLIASTRAVTIAQSLPICEIQGANGPYLITNDCIDPIYNALVIDSEVNLPAPHHQVRGHFFNTTSKFTLYFPSKNVYQFRFFQELYPLQGEVARDDMTGFGVESGAFIIRVGKGNTYRTDAAVAKFSRTVAAKHYNDNRRIYGYAHGSSGGSLQMAGGAENCHSIWDGTMLVVLGTPISIPGNFASRSLAAVALAKKKDSIMDSLKPGGSGDPYKGLNAMETAVLREVTTLGLPLQAWQDFNLPADNSALQLFARTVKAFDPTYSVDFWTQSGYLGSEKSELGDLFRAQRTEYNTTIDQLYHIEAGNLTSVRLGEFPCNPGAWGLEVSFQGPNSKVTFEGNLHPNKTLLFEGDDVANREFLEVGQTVQISNHLFLAVHSYHRHQIPSRTGFSGFDRFRDAQGLPTYPQRSLELGPILAKNPSRKAKHTGVFDGKLFVVGMLLDVDAFPLHADWYRNIVAEALGVDLHKRFRIYFHDAADHYTASKDPGFKSYRIVNNIGMIERALRHMSDWVEKNITAPASTHYIVKGGQIIVPETAAQRLGYQAVVDLSVAVEFPPDPSTITLVEWDFLGTGNYTVASFVALTNGVNATAKFAYSAVGTYFAGVRVTGQGNTQDNYAKVMNIGRVRFIVDI